MFSTRVTLCSKGAGAQLLEIYLETALEVDEEMHLCIVLSSLAATSARGVFQSNFPELLTNLTPMAVFAMRKLEPQMVNTDKVSFLTYPPLFLPGVINLTLHLSSNSPPVTFRPVKNGCARSWKKELSAPTTFPVLPKVLAYC